MNDQCSISGKQLDRNDLTVVGSLRPELAKRILHIHPALTMGSLISRDEVSRFRSAYVSDLLRQESGELNTLDKEVEQSLLTHTRLTENSDEMYDEQRSFGERIADVVAKFGGSWTFILSFLFILSVWIAVNGYVGEKKAFDPFPFILLNLVLSCIAALQAPIIMMSQRRQEAKDRQRSDSDYKVNLKAELEIRHLHEKLDHLMNSQWQRLQEIQQLQLELLQDAEARHNQ